jgi:two-component system OmpR family response regulator
MIASGRVRLNLRILVVEDDPDIREMLVASLSEEGVAQGAADGQEALEVLARGPAPTVILLDLRMPRLSGEGFLRALDRLPSHPPVVTMSACTRQPPPGAWAHLDKPFTIEEAIGVLRRVCRKAAGDAAAPQLHAAPQAPGHQPRPTADGWWLKAEG